MKNLADLINEKLVINKNVNDTKDVLVYSADTGGQDHELAIVFIKNTDEDIEDFVTYWWREELPSERPDTTDEWKNSHSPSIRKKYKEYFDEVKNYVDEIKDESMTLADYINKIYNELEKSSWIFSDNIN